MNNWTIDEYEAMKGYIVLATKYMKAEDQAEGVNEEIRLSHLFKCLDKATEDMTTEEARKYFLDCLK